MEKNELLKHVQRLINQSSAHPYESLIEARELLRTTAQKNNEFSEALRSPLATVLRPSDTLKIISTALAALKNHIESDLFRTISVQREIEIETVSDLPDTSAGPA